jgi:hypothetical protein
MYTGDYVTEETCQVIWRRAAEAALADITQPTSRLTPKVKALKERLHSVEDEAWNTTDYRSIVEEFTNIMAEATPEQALDMCQAGLDACHDQLLYRIDDTTIVPVKDAFVLSGSFEKLTTEVIRGTKPLKQNDTTNPPFPLGLVDPQDTTKTLYGLDACAQVDAWYKYGVMETSACVLAKTSLTCSTSTPLVQNKIFCLLGVTSELGPAKTLLQLPGVTVLGIAREGPKVQELRDFVIFHSPENTELRMVQGGSDLLLQGPQIASWILEQTKPPSPPPTPATPNDDDDDDKKKDLLNDIPTEGDDDEATPSPKPTTTTTTTTKPKAATASSVQYHAPPKKDLVLLPLASVPEGEENVRLCVAMDLIIQRIVRQRDGLRLGKTMLVQYTSPTTCMVLPPTASSTAQRRLQTRPSWESWASTLTGGRWLQPNLPNTISSVNNNDYTVVNGIMTAQGPHYVLAKTIQLWRCMTSYYRDDMIVAAPFAPLTRTASMTRSSPSVAIALEGMHHFEPMIAFDARPASTLMAAIMLSQIQLLNRPLPDMDENPFTILWDGAVHGGIWTCPYSLQSISTLNWILGKKSQYYYPKGYIPPGALPPPPVPQETFTMHADGTPKTLEEQQAEAVKRDEAFLAELEDSQYGKPMPDCVRERLEFM